MIQTKPIQLIRLYSVGGGDSREEGNDDKEEDKTKYNTIQHNTNMMMMLLMMMMMTITNTYAGTRVMMLFYCWSGAATVLVPAALLRVVDDIDVSFPPQQYNPIQSCFTANDISSSPPPLSLSLLMASSSARKHHPSLVIT